ALGLRLYRLTVELMPSHAGDLETLARLSERETVLWPLGIYLEALEVDREKASNALGQIDRFLARSNGVIFLDVREARRELNRGAITIDVGTPPPSEQAQTWTAALGPESQDLAATLAAQFNLSLAMIQ